MWCLIPAAYKFLFRARFTRVGSKGLPHSFISGDIDGVGLIPALYGVGKGDDMGLVVGEHLRQRDLELLVRWVVGPQAKDSAGQEVGRKTA